MAHFHLYTSNKLEYLAQVLGEILATPLDPMTPEIIVVHSGGMQRWLSMHLTRQRGVLANARFPFPVAFTYDLARNLLDDLPANYALSQERMLWRIAQLLPDLALDPDFAPIKAYLADADPLKLVQLAEKIAFHFDQYLIFRPHWSKLWEQGLACGDLRNQDHLLAEAWQAKLWQKLAHGFEETHRAALVRRTRTALSLGQKKPTLGPRLTIFGIPTLPPSYLDLFLALGNHLEVNAFVLSPSYHYWGDLPGKQEQLRKYRDLVQAGRLPAPRPEDRTLLANLGALGRDFHELLIQRGVEPNPLYQDNPAPKTLLEHLHQDLLNPMRHQDQAHGPIELEDTSIQVHCCHGPMREMEVLRDNILDLLQKNPDLEPRDILVMSPDIETYAPFIQAVFGCPADPAQTLPFSIADHHPKQTAQQVRLLLDLLEFGQSRFEASQVLALLESPLIRAVLRIDEADCARIEEWINQTAIRWGADLAFRQESNLADFAQNTWESGLKRLFLGYMTGPAPDPLHDVAPVGPLSSADQILLARLAAFVDNLRQLWTKINTPGTAQKWQKDLLWLLDMFFPQHRDRAEALLTLRTSITSLTETMHENAPGYVADQRTILDLLTTRLDASKGEGRFLSSGLTFCGLKLMRSIPFRVICLAGLSSTGFPRQNAVPGFDLLTARPLPGDRNHRDDDRYLFLESLISAQEYLILTYPGLSQNEGTEAPVSVLVAELLDYLDSHYRVRGQEPSKILVTRHRLQAFHPDYFDPQGPLFSYCLDNWAGARALCAEPVAVSFFTTPVAQEPKAEVGLDELIDFLAHPLRYLLRHMRITPARDATEILDEEPLGLPDNLKNYTLGQDVLQAILEEISVEQVQQRLQAWQVLPPGPAGRDASAHLIALGATLSAAIHKEQNGLTATLHDLRLDLEQGSLQGRVVTYGQCLLTYRPATCKGQDLLQLWVMYLAARTADLDTKGVHISWEKGKNSTFHTPDLDPLQAREILSDLLTLYQSELHRPVLLFPRASLEFAQNYFQGQNKKNKEKSLWAAQQIWEGNYKVTPERKDPYLALAFRDQDPDWEEFMDISIHIYAPLFGSRA